VSDFAVKKKPSATRENASLRALATTGDKQPEGIACHDLRQAHGRDFVMLKA
jgi:hypothetical protein